MINLQATFEIAVDLGHLFDLDLSQRGFYYLSVEFEDSQTARSNVEVHLLNASNKQIAFPSIVSNQKGLSNVFQLLNRHQDIALDNSFLFRCHRLVSSENILNSISSMTFQLIVKLYFLAKSDISNVSREDFDVASERIIQLHIDPVQGLHGYTMLLFDYCFMAAVEMTIHACVVALHQPLLQTLLVCHTSKPNEKEKITLETILFPAALNSNASSTQISHAIDVHNSIVSILYAIYAYLKSYLIILSEKLPEKCKDSHEYSNALMKICNMEESIKQAKTKDELLDQANMNLASACSYILGLWSYTLEIVCLNRNVMNDLAALSHKQRIQRFQSFFFTTKNPRCLFDEQRLTLYNTIANEIRVSNYGENLSPLLVEALENDGIFPSLPIVFEDQYLYDCTVVPVFRQHGSEIIENNQKLTNGTVLNGLNDSVNKSHSSYLSYMNGSANQDHGFISFSQDIFTHTLEEPDELPSFQSLLSAASAETLSSDQNFTGPGYKNQLNGIKKMSEKIKCKSKSTNDLLTIIPTSEINAIESQTIPVQDSKKTTKKVNDSRKTSDNELLTLEAFLEQDIDFDQEDFFETSNDLTYKCKSCQYLNEVQNETTCITTVSGLWQKLDSKHTVAKNKLLSELKFPGNLYSDLSFTIPLTPYITQAPNFVEGKSNFDSHLIILVHGLDGSESDMRVVRAYLFLGLQSILRSSKKTQMPYKFLLSSANAYDTSEDMHILSKRLEKEILEFIDCNYYSTNEPKRISFIGHSLGGLLLRSAIASDSMKHLRSRFHTFLSFASPHLGTMFNSSPLVNTGLWLMQKLRRSTCLRQLSCKEESNFRNTFIYKLSKKPGLKFLKNILLVASAEDKYVPYHSARIEMCKAALKDKSLGLYYNEMINNLLTPVHDNPKINLLRYHVVHSLPSFTTDSYIGRSAHIAPLESSVFLEQFLLVTALQYFI